MVLRPYSRARSNAKPSDRGQTRQTIQVEIETNPLLKLTNMTLQKKSSPKTERSQAGADKVALR